MKSSLLVIGVSLFSLMIGVGACSSQTQNEQTDKAGVVNSTVSNVKMIVPVFEHVDPKVKAEINGFLVHYFEINRMLIQDDQKGAQQAARKLSEAVNKFEIANLTGEQMDFYLTEVAGLHQGFLGIVEGSDIEKSRVALATLSESMYALVKAYHPNEAELYYQFCPMAREGKGANWLSDTKKIANPYMGQMMPACGKTEETIYKLDFEN